MKSLRDQIITKCVHFNGIQHDGCKVGVRYKDVRDEGKGLPCFSDSGATTKCEQARFRTDAEADARVAEINKGLEEALGRTARGECMHCGSSVATYKQSGHCAYAEPCGHRFGQADAKALNKALAALRAPPQATPDKDKETDHGHD